MTDSAAPTPQATGVILTTADLPTTRSAMTVARCAGWLIPGSVRGTVVLPEAVDGKAVRADVLAAALSLATDAPVLLVWWSTAASGYLLWSGRKPADQHLWPREGDAPTAAPRGDAAVLAETVPLPFPDDSIVEALRELLATPGHPMERVHALCSTLALPVEGFGVLAGGAPVQAMTGAEHVGRASLGGALRQALRRREN